MKVSMYYWSTMGPPLLAGLGVALIAAGCATIMNGTKQEVWVSSTPTGASVFIDNLPHGTTPVTARVNRKQRHTVRIEMNGYETFEMVCTRKVSGWVWGSITFALGLGLVVDINRGSIYKIVPKQVEATLIKKGAALLGHEEDVIYIGVVSKPELGWERIGTLESRYDQKVCE